VHHAHDQRVQALAHDDIVYDDCTYEEKDCAQDPDIEAPFTYNSFD